MSHKLVKQIAVEREQLNRLLETHRPLLVKCAAATPDVIELSALAAMLHAFYGGVENIFRRVAVELDRAPPGGAAWHRALLNAMTRPGAFRPPVISERLRESLRGYLDFRHVFRQAYTFELRWQRMAVLVRNCEETLRVLERELDVFVAAIGPADSQ